MTDVDLNEQEGSFVLVTMGCDHGTLTLSTAVGLRFVSGGTTAWAGGVNDVSFDGVASFYAGLTNANIALAGITYRPHRDWNGNDTLSVAADDRGFSTEVSKWHDASTTVPGAVWRRGRNIAYNCSVYGRGIALCMQLAGMAGGSSDLDHRPITCALVSSRDFRLQHTLILPVLAVKITSRLEG